MSDTTDELEEFQRQIAEAMPGDRGRLRGKLRSMKKAQSAGKPFDRNLKRFSRDLKRSVELRTKRVESKPQIKFGDDLPVLERREEIAQAIRENQVVVICGETGSGKSTQLPKICLDMGRGVDGMIGHTQPRRIAARSVATRIAEEMSVPVGDAVGFKVRFADATKPSTYIKLMTDGILLAESQGDRLLNQYDTLIIDEAHERSLNIDFLLGYLKSLLPKRPELKVIITSATIDAERFAEHFSTDGKPAPVVEVSGRTYPVEVRYRPPVSDSEDNAEPDPTENMLEAVEEVCREGNGDVLVFMPTERDIRDAAKRLRGKTLPGDYSGATTEILPLYGRLSAAEQSRVFQTHPHRRIVIATNVAESSLTVPHIRYVVDTGTARISRYSSRSGVQRLPIEAVSKASADQRKGRCGRVGPGVCVRLYSEEDYENREDYTQPEILRTNLASVILQLKMLGLGDVESFPFLESPKPGAIRNGYATLYELGALDAENQITDIGRTLGKLPVDPRIGRMVLAGNDERCLHEILIIAAALEIQDPRERPVDKQQAADQQHEKFADTDSDFISYLKLWEFYHKLKDDLSKSRLRRACQKNFLSYNRLREWTDVFRQLRELADECGCKKSSKREDYDAIHRALLTGLLTNVALKQDKERKNEYQSAGGHTVWLWPGSGLIEKKPKWVVSAEQIETAKRYARVCARINPAWIEPIAGDLVKKSHSDPYWDAEQGTVFCNERVTLLGLPIIPRRRVRFGPIDMPAARTLFVQHGLVEEELEAELSFIVQNRKLRAEAEEQVSKSRRVELLRGEADRFQFYDERLPHDVFDLASLHKWWKKAAENEKARLSMRRSDVIAEESDEPSLEAFPDGLTIAQVRLPLEYHLEPGAEEDGVTLVVPRGMLGQVPPNRLGWLVPGLVTEKVEALTRTLPKSLRTRFVPVPETAKEVVGRLKFGHGNFEDLVAKELTRLSGEPIAAPQFDADRLPTHLRMNVRVVDAEGNTIATGRDIAALQRGPSLNATEQPKQSGQPVRDAKWHRDGLTQWDFGPLPPTVTTSHGDFELQAFPTLIDRGDRVDLRLAETPQEAAATIRAGLRRLFLLKHGKRVRGQVDHLPNVDRHLMTLSPFAKAGEVRRQLEELIADRAFFAESGIPRDEQQFAQRADLARERLGVAAQEVGTVFAAICAGLPDTRKPLDKQCPPMLAPAVDDMQRQLKELFEGDFLLNTPWAWLQQFPRYLQGIRARHARLQGGGLSRDQKMFEQLRPYLKKFAGLSSNVSKHSAIPGPLVQFRWMLEEFRISLFAQQLGTAIKISAARLDEQFEAARRSVG
ncbi:ATP-dependent RNA helicase HrpA [Stratiformator vulcanicus]|uniref:ATP-dependent RNA helicase HrpB n=1 Tax=Stratiformator vulcanicus TaxID=2527980 RepID=A0A517R115_9PLAN|nr:ATP-dependent RNA helicase HrpA [Stratiformator vulcanicus]QDT37568.1 ATP-dependent RNA helicase HrpB [Stratiformator vulcanicus]